MAQKSAFRKAATAAFAVVAPHSAPLYTLRDGSVAVAGPKVGQARSTGKARAGGGGGGGGGGDGGGGGGGSGGGGSSSKKSSLVNYSKTKKKKPAATKTKKKEVGRRTAPRISK